MQPSSEIRLLKRVLNDCRHNYSSHNIYLTLVVNRHKKPPHRQLNTTTHSNKQEQQLTEELFKSSGIN